MNKKMRATGAVLIVLFCLTAAQKLSAQSQGQPANNQNSRSAPTVTQTPSSTPTPAPTPETTKYDCKNIYNDTGLDNGFLGIGKSDFSDITEVRDRILGETAKLEQQIAGLEAERKTAPPQSEIDQIKTADDSSVKSAILDLPVISSVQNLKSREQLDAQIEPLKKEYELKRHQKQCIQSIINKIYTPEQSFKLWMSITFAVLICLVIAGFFWLAGKDEVIRRAIFSGQTGIQFLTLFSIVIAIILFGITGILEDKELAALLGGLSGYILGRYSQGNSKPEPPPPPPNPPLPSGNQPADVPAGNNSTVIKPKSGSVAGGAAVKITETGFKAIRSVRFGETPAVNATIDAASVITATTPAHGQGVVQVTIESDDGRTAQTSFEYLGE